MQRNKRLRVFAGPNGSGKSTLFEVFKKQYDPGYFINADEIEKQLRISKLIDLLPLHLLAYPKDLLQFSKTKEALSLIEKAKDEGRQIQIEIRNNFIVSKTTAAHSYEASYTAAFLRWLLYKNEKSFSFETVMSHVSKVKELKDAQVKGYKTYFYFVCTNDPEINMSRVATRVSKGGHKVSEKKIKSRYIDTLKNVREAIKYSDNVYFMITQEGIYK